MSARKKMNAMYSFGAAAAAFLGVVYQSWAVFATAVILFSIMNLMAGHVRLAANRR